MRLVGWLIGAVIAAVLVAFAVSNRVIVPLKIEPLPFVVELPLYLALFASLVAGFVVGGFVAWLGGGRWRRRARRAEAEAARLRLEMSEAKKAPQAAQTIQSGAGAELQRLPRAS